MFMMPVDPSPPVHGDHTLRSALLTTVISWLMLESPLLEKDSVEVHYCIDPHISNRLPILGARED